MDNLYKLTPGYENMGKRQESNSKSQKSPDKSNKDEKANKDKDIKR